MREGPADDASTGIAAVETSATLWAIRGSTAAVPADLTEGALEVHAVLGMRCEIA